MKKLYVLISMVLMALIFFSGCDSNKQLKVGLLIHDLEKERWENDRDYFVEKVQELGGAVLLEVANNDAAKQLEQAKLLLKKGVDVLVVIPVDQFAAAEIVKLASDKNIKVISYDRLILNCKLDYYVSTDNVEIGEIQAEYLTTIKPTGDYAIVGGAQRDHNSQFLYLGQMNVLQPLVDKGDINIVYNEFTEAWSEEEGYKHTLAMLEKTDGEVDALIAGNDAIASGVIRALKEAGIEKNILVAGMDADLKNLHEIIKGNQTCTIYKPIQKMATTAAQIAIKLAKCEECEKTYQTVSNGEMLVPSVLHNAMVVNSENLKLTVISEGYQKEEEVFK